MPVFPGPGKNMKVRVHHHDRAASCTTRNFAIPCHWLREQGGAADDRDRHTGKLTRTPSRNVLVDSESRPRRRAWAQAASASRTGPAALEVSVP